MNGPVDMNQPDVLTPDYCYICVSYSTTVTCDCTRVLQTPLHNHRNCENCGVDVCEETGVCIVYMSSSQCVSVCVSEVSFLKVHNYVLCCFLLFRPSLDSVRFTALTWTQLTFQISIDSFYSGVFKLYYFCRCIDAISFTSSFVPKLSTQQKRLGQSHLVDSSCDLRHNLFPKLYYSPSSFVCCRKW